MAKKKRLIRLISISLAALCCVCLLAAGLGGCSDVPGLASSLATGVFPVEVNGVTVNSRPQKVAVLSPSLADVVLALGCETQLIAGPETCTQEALRDLQKINASDAQAVTGTGPDLVLLDPSSAGVEQALKDAGLTVINIAPAVDREDFERLYAQVSSALNGGEAGYDQGIATAQDVFLTLDNITRLVPNDRITIGCYLYDLEGSGVTGDMFATTIMTYSGVTNALKSLSGGSYSFDDLKVSDPDVIFCRPGLKEEIEGDSRFEDFQAVQEDKVVELDPSLMEWQGRTVVSAAYEITAAAFPELLEESNMKVTDPTEKIDSDVSSALVSSAPEDDTTAYETLQERDQGEEVLKMQSRLDELGYLELAYDGYYGEHTVQCVKDFQRVNGLPETGVADADTLRRLYSSQAKPKDGGMASGSEASPSPDASPSPEAGGSPAPSAPAE